VTLSPENEDAVRRIAFVEASPARVWSGRAWRVTAQSMYADLMKQRFAPFLREAGLRGSGGRFQLGSGIALAAVGFQKSAHNDRDDVRFTINLSAIPRDEWESRRAAMPYLGAESWPGRNSTTYPRRPCQLAIRTLAQGHRTRFARGSAPRYGIAARRDSHSSLGIADRLMVNRTSSRSL